MTQLKATWVDDHREPTQPPNAAYPDGVDLDISQGATRVCSIALPCPAKRCGYWVVRCAACGLRVAVTTAGRPDDPRSLKVACKEPAQ